MALKRFFLTLMVLLLAAGLILSGCTPKTPASSVAPTASQEEAGPSVSVAKSASAAPSEASQAKNVILLIGDGMGFGQITLGRIAGGNKPLTMDSFEHTGTVSTYPNDPNNLFVTDSAAAGTAMATGVKTTNGTISEDSKGNVLKTILEYAKDAGKSTGVVTTSYLADATPAAFTAHDDSRGDQDDIAVAMLKTAPDLMMGGGESSFSGGSRKDKVDLEAQAAQEGYTLVKDKKGLQSFQKGKLLAFFAQGKMPYVIDGNKNAPTLKDMAVKALNVLSKDKDGFFVMIEGGRIDHACHAHDAPTAAKEVAAFDQAIAAALDFAKKDGNTLVIVTADHETGGLSIGADAQGMTFISSMLKKQVGSIYEKILNDVDWDLTDLDYAAFVKTHFGIASITQDEKTALGAAYKLERSDRTKYLSYFGRSLAALASSRTNTGWTTREHSGNDVAVMAYGPASSSVGGHMDNTDIFKLMKKAMGL